ncbi:MAG: DUF1211 domain-containing protein [bacterium]|jgi:uncharacterized membrane protein|nr:DUF1211 domain-containing protein [bacterium]
MSEDEERAEEPQAAGDTDRDDGGYGLGRLLALSDGVFAIAMTLLVLSIPVPGLGDHPSNRQVTEAVLNLAPNLTAFAVSFIIVGNYWRAHHRAFRQGERVDSPLLWLNLVVLLFVCLVPFTTDFQIHYGSTTAAIEVYYGNLAIIGIAFAVLGIYGHRRRLVPYPTRQQAIRAQARGLTPAVAFMGAMVVGLFAPRLAGPYGWLLLFPANLLLRAILPRIAGPAGRP